jgi:hypothetical protein
MDPFIAKIDKKLQDQSTIYATKIVNDVITRLSLKYGFDVTDATKIIYAIEPYKSRIRLSKCVSETKDPKSLLVSDIECFFTTSKKQKNDETNNVREDILEIINVMPDENFNDPVYGPRWMKVRTSWNDALKMVADKTSVHGYTSVKIFKKGGRTSHYDFSVSYYNEDVLIATRQIEFKNGAKDITDLPQFLCLAANKPFLPETYDTFYYKNWLGRYIACDSDITEQVPSLLLYIKSVSHLTPKDINNSSSAFFSQLKSREKFFKLEKKRVINSSITDYLTRYGNLIDIEYMYDKFKNTQSNKHYLLWCNGKFYYDTLSISEMKFHSIKNGNMIVLNSGNTQYELLLRWKNHNGILNPAWQIGMKRSI